MGREPTGREITPESVYFNRRTFLKAGVTAAAAVGTVAVYRKLNGQPAPTPEPPPLAGLVSAGPSATPGEAAVAAPGPASAPATEAAAAAAADVPVSESMRKAFTTDEAKTPFQNVTHYNNFYEFSTGKEEVALTVGGFTTAGWKVTVDGLVSKPATFDLDMLRKAAPLEERIYRMRCVEAWSMVVPWAGYSLSKLLAKVQPKSDAKFVAFTTLFDPKRFPGQDSRVLAWPYVEGLRLDEAMNPLTLVTLGLYGKELPAQDGAPVRMVMPWKYGFKGIKSIVKISLVSEMPPTSWNRYSSEEYGFYANVNPNHPHPRWSQAMERRLTDTVTEIPTQMFNGYGEQVASMYQGMDLDENF